MSLVERCWMITSKFSVIAILIITGICFGVFVYPYMKKKREAALVSIVYIGIMSVLYLIPQQIGNFSAYMLGVVAAFLVMYVQDRRNIYQKIFLAVTFFSIRWLAVAMAGRMDDLSQKLWFWEYDCRKTMAAICTLCWNENSGYCALYHFPCSRNRSDQ